jgi:hypothetical protein
MYRVEIHCVELVIVIEHRGLKSLEPEKHEKGYLAPKPKIERIVLDISGTWEIPAAEGSGDQCKAGRTKLRG